MGHWSLLSFVIGYSSYSVYAVKVKCGIHVVIYIKNMDKIVRKTLKDNYVKHRHTYSLIPTTSWH